MVQNALAPGGESISEARAIPPSPSTSYQMPGARNLMTLNSMGKLIQEFDGDAYVKSWFGQGHHLAGDSHIKERITSLIPKNTQTF